MVRVGHALAKTFSSFFLNLTVWHFASSYMNYFSFFSHFFSNLMVRHFVLSYMNYFTFFSFFSNLTVWHFASSDMNYFSFFSNLTVWHFASSCMIIFLFFLFFQIWWWGTLLYLYMNYFTFFLFFFQIDFASSDMNYFPFFLFFKSDSVAFCFVLYELFNSHVENWFCPAMFYWYACERSCICVLGVRGHVFVCKGSEVMYLCARDIDFASFYDFSNGFYNFSDSVTIFSCI